MSVNEGGGGSTLCPQLNRCFSEKKMQNVQKRKKHVFGRMSSYFEFFPHSEFYQEMIKKAPNYFVGVHKKWFCPTRGGRRSESYGHVRNY